MAASIKSSALATDGIAVLVAVACYWRLANRREIPDIPYYLASIIALFAVPMLAIASFWYFRTWVGYGSPFYPVVVIGLPGKGTFNDIIIGGNWPTHWPTSPGARSARSSVRGPPISTGMPIPTTNDWAASGSSGWSCWCRRWCSPASSG